MRITIPKGIDANIAVELIEKYIKENIGEGFKLETNVNYPSPKGNGLVTTLWYSG